MSDSGFDNRARDRKISQFPAQQTVPADSVFTFVSGGVNYKVTFPNLLAALGATGVIQQEGDPLGAPVLDDQGGVFGIRNIESGPGILATISPQNGVYVEHNFEADVTGVPVLLNPTAASPKIRSIVAGSGIAVSPVNGSIQISTSGVPVSNRTVVINALSDFPASVGGVITLEANTQYYVFNSINTGTTRFVMAPGVVIEGADSSVISMTYTGAGNMFTAVDSSVRFGRITLDAASGTVLDFTSTTQTHGCQFNDMTIGSCANIASVNGASYIYFFDTYCTFAASGVTVTGTVSDFISIPNSFFTSSAGAVLDISGATLVQALAINDNRIMLLGASSLFISANGDANINLTAGIGNNRINNSGGGAILSGVSTANTKWSFSENDLLRDSRPIGAVSLTSNATATVISTINTPVLVAGTWTSQATSLFSTTAAGRITSTNPKSARCTIEASGSVLMAAGGNNAVTLYLYKNGSIVSAARCQTTTDASDPRVLSLTWQDVVNNGDYYELFIENNADTDNIIVRHCNFRVVT